MSPILISCATVSVMDIPQAGRSSIESLPVESLRVICESVDRSSDLWAFALCNWMLNEVATPALYSTIDIEVFSSIYSCVRSLASAPSKTTLTRDLASFVETISLYDPNYRDEPTRQKCWQCNVIDSNIEKAVGRMRRLRSFVCRMGIYHSAETFLTLASGTLPFVRDIDMQAVLPRAQTDADNAMTAPIALSRTGLRTLKLGLYSSTFSASYREFICSLLAASRCTLESLSLRFKALDALRPAWQSIPSFPVLQELSVPPAILKEPAFQDTSSIRHIILRGLEDFLQLTPSDLPNLEDVTCFPDQLQYFLIKGAEHRRPIKTVTLSHVKYERTYLGGYYAIGHDYALEWERHICPALGMLQYSGAYLTRLSFLVGSLCVRTLSRFLPVFIKLEFLAIMLQFAPGEVRLLLSFHRATTSHLHSRTA